MTLPDPTELVPHRPPFLFVDRLSLLEPGAKAAGSWTLSGEEWFFSGHFPDRPTLPGVLMLEALAQLGACGVLSEPKFANKLPLFGGASKVKFRRQVLPGDTLDLEVELTRLGSRAGKGHGRASVNDETACEAELMFVIVDA